MTQVLLQLPMAIRYILTKILSLFHKYIIIYDVLNSFEHKITFL